MISHTMTDIALVWVSATAGFCFGAFGLVLGEALARRMK
jgi:hypothetical protein